jgi:hypothetical protein
MKNKKLFIRLSGALLILLLMGGCNENPSVANLFFPVTQAPASQHMDSLATGKLVAEGNILGVKSGWFFDKGDVLIWPYGYSLGTQNARICVIDSEGQVVAKVGDSIKLGGGEISRELAEEQIGRPLPSDISGSFWLIGSVIKN